ncbi:MAG: DUF2480 family protein [Flavobacteriaceae bacterium]|nr:DUF2480 family protein [Flavobacteriaceae bacterium]
MEGEIVNRVAKSSLITIDLEEFYPDGNRVVFDIKDWLWEGLVLKEKEFRSAINDHNWEEYEDKFIAINCSGDAIIPAWAYMLVAVKLKPYAKRIVHGNLKDLETALFIDVVETLDLQPFKDKPIIIKGCSQKPVPENAYIHLISRLEGVARSIQYGEACSSVPLYKKSKN